MSEARTGGGFLAGIVIGGLLGAGIALLLAPKSGQETRDELMDRSVELRERASELAARAWGDVDELVSRGRSVVEDTTATFRDAYSQGTQAAAEQAEELQRRFREARGYPGDQPQA
ncbi:MAG: YtxH domain-containing protein [Chloroflexota bacterium]|nr:MAG: YtxH domain-containing protein [Chloroflexota bacterium]